jgi:hypothetical protein
VYSKTTEQFGEVATCWGVRQGAEGQGPVPAEGVLRWKKGIRNVIQVPVGTFQRLAVFSAAQGLRRPHVCRGTFAIVRFLLKDPCISLGVVRSIVSGV